MKPAERQALFAKIKKYNELLWESRVVRPHVEEWLLNFKGEALSKAEERDHSLYLLSKFLYFGRREVRKLLETMFLEHFRNPIQVKLRSTLANKEDFARLHSAFLAELQATRFLGLGNPAESATHILYDFRQANGLPKNLFASPHELFRGDLKAPSTLWASTDIRRLIFIDDFCGTGNQAEQFATGLLPHLRAIAVRSGVALEIWYLTLLSTTEALESLKSSLHFDRVECVSELDHTYKTFDGSSQVYRSRPHGLQRQRGLRMAHHYGSRLRPGIPLGYGDCQLLLGFHHNVPDNTLPVFWHSDATTPWRPIFPRSDKL